MAGADTTKLGTSVARNYYSCDLCGAKTFYDANLNYSQDDARTGRLGYYLEGVGDIKCICDGCAKTNEIVIVPITLKDNKA